MTAHCLICNLSLEESYKQLNIFDVVDCHFNRPSNCVPINEVRSRNSESVFSVLGQVLNRPLESVILHSQVICQDCFSKLVTILDVKNRLHTLQTEFISSFEQTACARAESTCTNNVSLGPTDPLTPQTSQPKTEESSLKDPPGDLLQITSSIDIKAEGNISPLQEQDCVIDKSADFENLYVCEKCGKSFSSNNDWVEHMLIHIDAKPHPCTFCKQMFQTLNDLKVHERTHKDYKPYECDKCGKSFSERHYLSEHMLVHTDRKPFKCSVCNRDFSRRKDMMTHVKLHTGERPHSCPHCPKKFVVRSRLNRHMKTHSQERPHQCKICLKSFVRHNDFKTHERLHTGIKPYKCTQCDKSFGSTSNFRAHERRHKNALEKKNMMNSNTLPDSTGDHSTGGQSTGDPSTGDPSTGDHPTGDHSTGNHQGDLSSVGLLTDGHVTDPLDVKPKEITGLEKQSIGITLSENINSGDRTLHQSQETMQGKEPVIFSAGDSQTNDITTVPQRLPSLVNFRSPSVRNKSSEPPLPLGIDLSNVTLQNENANITGQQPYVLMQFPLLPEPPPLVLYSTPRNSEQAAQLANSMLAESALQNNLSQVQVLRWDNADDVDALLRDNSNVPALAQTLFQSKEISDAFN